jgi:hypothetical protein
MRKREIMSVSDELAKYIRHCLKKDEKPFRSDVGPLQKKNGVNVFVTWSVFGSPENTGQGTAFLDVNQGDSTLTSVPGLPGQPNVQIPLPVSISGDGYWVGGPVPQKGVAIDTFKMKVKGPEKGKDALTFEIMGLDFADNDSVSAKFPAAPLSDGDSTYTGSTKTKSNRTIAFFVSLTTGTHLVNLAAK